MKDRDRLVYSVYFVKYHIFLESGEFSHYYASTMLPETNIIKFTHAGDGFCQVYNKNWHFFALLLHHDQTHEVIWSAIVSNFISQSQ